MPQQHDLAELKHETYVISHIWLLQSLPAYSPKLWRHLYKETLCNSQPIFDRLTAEDHLSSTSYKPDGPDCVQHYLPLTYTRRGRSESAPKAHPLLPQGLHALPK